MVSADAAPASQSHSISAAPILRCVRLALKGGSGATCASQGADHHTKRPSRAELKIQVRQVARSRHQGRRLPAPREPGGYRPDLATDAVATPECSLDEWAPGSMLRARPATVSRPPHSAAGRKVSGVNSPIGPTAACLTLLLILSTVSIGRFRYKSNRPRAGISRRSTNRARPCRMPSGRHVVAVAAFA